MTVYKKRVSTKDPRWRNRKISFITNDGADMIPVEDTVVICNGCNRNIFDLLHPEKETFGWLIYFDKRDVKADRPYDVYCGECTQRSFPEAIEVH